MWLRVICKRFLVILEQVTGIEPVTYPWEGYVLPLNYTCEKQKFEVGSKCFNRGSKVQVLFLVVSCATLPGCNPLASRIAIQRKV